MNNEIRRKKNISALAVLKALFCEKWSLIFVIQVFLIDRYLQHWLLDENITWKNHTCSVEKIFVKNIDLLYLAKYLLDESSLKTVYFSYIHSYLNYAKIAWASTYQAKLKAIYYYQKHAAWIVFNQEKATHSMPLLRSLNALNIYQINLYQHLNFMYKASNNVAPLIFNDMFKKPLHKYPKNFSHSNFSLKKCSLNSTKYSYFFQRT